MFWFAMFSLYRMEAILKVVQYSYCTILSTDVQPHCANSQSQPDCHEVNMLSENDLCCPVIAVAAIHKRGKARRKAANWPNSGLLRGESSTMKTSVSSFLASLSPMIEARGCDTHLDTTRLLETN